MSISLLLPRRIATLIFPLLILSFSMHAQTIPQWDVAIDSSANNSMYWRDVAAADARHHVIVGFADDTWSVLRSVDAGESWSHVLATPARDSVQVRAIAHPSADVILLLCDSTFNRGLSGLDIRYDYTTFVLRSSDGGSSWQRIPVGSRFRTRQSRTIRMASPSIGYIVQLASEGESTDRFWKTIDGGATWIELPLPTSFLATLDMAVAGSTVVLRSATTIARSENVGGSWETFASTLPMRLYSLDFPSSMNGFAAGARGTGKGDEATAEVFRTVDGGRTWQSVFDSLTNGSGLRSIRFADLFNGIAVGGGGIFRTNDGGTTWRNEATPIYNSSEIAIGSLAMTGRDTIVGVGLKWVLRYAGKSTLATPRITVPSVSITTNASSLRLEWTPIIGSDRYELQVVQRDSVPELTPPPPFIAPFFVEQTTVDTAYMINGLTVGKEYIARVRANGSSMTSSWSALRFILAAGTATVREEVRNGRTMQVMMRHGDQWMGMIEGLKENADYMIIDLLGRTVMHGSCDSKRLLITSGELAPGAYLIVIERWGTIRLVVGP